MQLLKKEKKMPKVYLVGQTEVNVGELEQYLSDTDQKGFMEDYNECVNDFPLRLVSAFAKLCYKSLVPGKNKNVTKTRGITANIKGIIDSGHGSVLEHIQFNFIVTDCSRVFTHELVRHRVGTAFSQTSGRYCALDDDSSLVLDPILGEYNDNLQDVFDGIVNEVEHIRNKLIDESTPFKTKKKITSALRRIAPSGLLNEIAFSANLRTLRHLIELRTSVHAEWEIRKIFNDIADILEGYDPLYLYGGTKNDNGSWTGLRV